MKCLDHTFTIGQDIIFVFAYIVRGQTTPARSQAHTAARRMKSNSQFLRGAYFIVESRIVRKQVQMIGNRCGSRQYQFHEAEFCADINRFSVHLPPDWVKGFKPVEQ